MIIYFCIIAAVIIGLKTTKKILVKIKLITEDGLLTIKQQGNAKGRNYPPLLLFYLHLTDCFN